MLNGGICTDDEQALFNSTRGTSIVCLTRGESIGLTLVAESGFISMVTVLGAFIMIFYKNGWKIQISAEIYMRSLFAFDIIMALGRVTDIKWIRQGKVYIGGYCTAQGVVQQLGETGSALATLTIAVHTFVVVFWNTQPHRHSIAYIIVGLTWIFVSFFVAMGAAIHTQGSNHYETPVGFWCWIGTHYIGEQLGGQYVWVWITVFVSFLAYTPLFFWARGNITVSEAHWWKFEWHSSADPVRDINLDDPNDRRWRSAKMIVFPVAFAVMTLPLSAVRWASGFGSSQHRLPTATFAVEFIYSLSGAVNVLLFFFARRTLLLPRNRLGAAPRDEGSGVQAGHELGWIPPAHPIPNGPGEAPGNVGPDDQIGHEPGLAASGEDSMDPRLSLGQAPGSA